ncbi:hypothetical protein B7C51_25050 (plasmid) [Paenibacillus larvae subsp. pulvifaciens]|uniref:Uncharacterized protein n=2 Tax=Paenibacillus larvae TaxID=1464 RepID=A0A1V0V074_9BACL|nr:hypothetical protein B7C51_25050 [Paenibacillus larvae subsp. pulvifaciens]
MDDNKQIIQRIPSSGNARVKQKRVPLGEVNGIPVCKTAFGEVEGLPEPQDGIVYIVSALTAQAAKDRNDLYVPDEQVRDSEGRIIGCRALAKI